MKIHGLLDSWGFELVVVFGLVGWFLEMAWKKHPSKDVSPSPAIFDSSWLWAFQDGFCSVPMVQDFASLYAQEEAREANAFRVISYRDSAQLIRGQRCSVKDSPRFTHHQYTIYMEGSQMVYFAADLRVLQWWFVALDPVRIGWRAKAGKLSSWRIFHPLGKSWWMWWGIFVNLLSWNTVMLHEFFSFSWVTVEWEL